MNPRPPEVVVLDVENACRALKERASDLSWEWDSRLSAALAVARDPEHETLLALVETQLPISWDYRTIRNAPKRIADVSAAWGGLRHGQKMLTFDPSDDPLLFAAWWPWGGGMAFSLRVSCAIHAAEAAAMDPLTVLRDCFGA